MLRGNCVDREILVSCDTLKKWDLIHSTFGRETVTDFINRSNSTCYNISNSRLIRNKVKNVNSLSQLYNKSQISTDELLGKIPSECVKLREKILKIHKRNFKEKLGPTDRINHEPVKLQIDESRGIKPVKHSKAYDIPIHLRESALAEFTEIRNAGIIVESDGEASEWSSQAFPRRKPNSYPIKCRWVTDSRDLNKALNRPIWGGESSGQLLRHIDPSARFFAVNN